MQANKRDSSLNFLPNKKEATFLLRKRLFAINIRKILTAKSLQKFKV